jgi:hypothetical protein
MAGDPEKSEASGKKGFAKSHVDAFCEKHGIGRTTFYSEVKIGRLRIKKLGRKTIVTPEFEAAWVESLPTA